ncbi:MAG: triose-phosphate isomerase [Betaproteobacteria bacterium]|nr:MAG: triose-phosphate isomerase [Betaproteobacteria bacterium]
MRSKLVAGNWKMHGSLTENEGLLGALKIGFAAGSQAQCAVCVPYPFLGQVQALLRDSPIAWGAQDVSEHAKGAYTGEVSASMLQEFGCRYVIVGHSERRAMHAENSRLVARKLRAAQSVGLRPILCVGETLAERERGVTEAVVSAQLIAVVEELGADALAQAVIAYEPVWAIGTGKTASPEQAQAVHASIRALLRRQDASLADSVQILYGGSVKAGNAAELFGMPDIDGGLVGGASLDAKEFLAICQAAG